MGIRKYPLDHLTEYFTFYNGVDDNTQYVVEEVDAVSLINPRRFDLMAKWLYIDAIEKQINITFAEDVYRDHIQAFSCGSFIEPGTEEKNSLDKYLQELAYLIDDIKVNGFDESKSLIPIGDNNEILDGSHRASVSAYYGKKVSIIKFPELHLSENYDYIFFTKHLMSVQNMGYMALEYTRHVNGCYMACIWPAADSNKIEMAEKILAETFQVVYAQNVFLTYQGLRNLMIQVYETDGWTGTLEDKYAGVDEKARACYKKNQAIRTVLFMADSLDDVVDVKRKIRELFNIENHSIHISDTDAETQMMAELLYNPNSVFFLNHADTYKYITAHKRIQLLRKRIVQIGLDPNRFIIDSSAVLEVCGLRQARDVDYLTDYDMAEKLRKLDDETVDEHSSQLRYHTISVKDMLYNPQNYFFYDGMKFLTIKRVKEMKKNRAERKDRYDIRLCDLYLYRLVYVPKKYRYNTLELMRRVQIKMKKYGVGTTDYQWFRKMIIKDLLYRIYKKASRINRKRK